jgi:hypothetical protein
MTALASSDVTITVQKKLINGKRKRNRVKIVFGDGALTYPAGGVPLPAFGQFGMKRFLEVVALSDANDGVGLVWKVDQENLKLRAYQAPAQTHAHDILIKGGQAAAGTAATAYYATDILGKEAATDKTILGVDSATKGGSLSSSLPVGPLVELGAVAVAAQTLYAEAVGW